MSEIRTFQRIGHGGASALARANTLAAFDAAAAIGIDAIEFDVRGYRGQLVLAHTVLHARIQRNMSLRSALAHLGQSRFDGIELHLDIKHPGLESAVLTSLAEAGLLERTLVCSQVTAVLDRFRALDPGVRVGISIGGRLPRTAHRWGDWRERVLAGLAAGRWDAVMAQHRLVDAELVAAVAATRPGASLYAWTVNERAGIERLRGLGVDGVCSADPRLFAG